MFYNSVSAKTLDELRDFKHEGFVIIDVAGNIINWANGVMQTLIDDNVATPDMFLPPFQITRQGKVDLVFVFANPNCRFNNAQLWCMCAINLSDYLAAK